LDNGVISGHFLFPDGCVRQGTVTIRGGKIADCEPGEPVPADSREPVVVPGFVDVHVHGGGGADVMDATLASLDTISATHAAHGTTTWLATTVTHFPGSIEQAIDAVKTYMRSDRNGASGARVAGLHLEGPYLNPKKRGAHREDALVPPDAGQLIRWCERAEGTVKMITLAPELEGAPEVIREATRRGIVVSAGHTDATWSEMETAVRCGLSHVTHLFNAMRSLHHREPGIVGFALSSRSVTADLIVDGVHVHPGIVDLALKAMGPRRLLLITDAIRAACMGDGDYDLGGLMVKVAHGIARIDNGALAGSLLTLDEAFRRLVTVHGLDLATASRMASLNPAVLLGLDQAKGTIEAGKDADLVCLDHECNVLWTMVGGRIVYRAED